MKVYERTFADLLKPKKTFVIPAFQRRYAWKANNFSQLWDDIRQVLDGARTRHFMGTVVFEPDGSDFSVIDGQQRLLTFTIILKVLHDLSREFASDRTKEIHRRLTGNPRGLIRPSLHDGEAINFLFENPTLLKKSAHATVKGCYDFFRKEISDYITGVKGQKPTHFAKIYGAVINKMVFVEIVLTDQDDTHAIFETINYAGVPLTAADLARNFVLGRAKRGEEQNRLNKEYWQPLENTLTEGLSGNTRIARRAELQKVLPEFLRTVLVLEKKKYIGSNNLFRELRLYFRDGSVEAKLQTLAEYAVEYKKFLRPSLEIRSRLQARLSHLLELRMTTYNPVLLVLFRTNANGGLKTTDLELAIQCIESFIVRRAFNSKVSRDLPKVFARVAIALRSETRDDRLLNSLRQFLAKEKWPSDEEFRPCFLSTPIYATARETARFALISLERHRPAANERVLNSTIQIEHVFPQGAKAPDWDEHAMPELKKRLHVMGNLTLTANNAKYSNHSFRAKCNGKDGYKRSPYWLTKTLTKHKAWSDKEIDRRSEHLLKVALQIWPGPNG